jgi:predicted alpha/beta-fold hydrolase
MMTPTATEPPAPAFVPARFLENPHAQTVYAALLRRTPTFPVVRERLELEDGDFLDVDTVSPPGASAHTPWVLVLHGLEGSSEAVYVRGLARGLVARGLEACLLNYRGCSGEPNRLARSYHSGETGDVRAALEALAARRPGRRIGLAGFSVGANLAMKLLGEEGDRTPVHAAVAISPPFDLERCATHLDRPGGWVYRERLLWTLRTKALGKIARFPGIASGAAVKAARTFFAFDEAFTAPVHGFENAHDYWAKASGVNYLEGVTRDLLIVSSDDDPFFPEGYVPHAAIGRNRNVDLVAPARGGHVAFVAGTALAPRFWAEELTVERLASRLLG